MPAQFLDFSFNFYSLLSLCSTLLVLGLLVVVAGQKYHTATIRWLEAVLFAVLAVALGEFLERSSGNAEMARAFRFINIMGYMFIPPTVLGFCLSFAGRTAWFGKLRFYLLAFLPAVIFLYFALTTNLYKVTDAALMHRTYYGHWTGDSGPVFIFGYVPWFNVMVFIGLWALWQFWHRQKNKELRSQARLLFLALLIPTLVGFVTDEILPSVERVEVVELATVCMAITSLLFVFGMMRYRLFEVNPGEIATNVLARMHELVMVFNARLELEFVNDATVKMLGYKREELIGQPLSELLEGWWKTNGQELVRKAAAGEEIVNVETQLATRKLASLPVGLSLSAYHDNKGQALAYVLVMTDRRNLQELLQVRAERDKLQATLASMTDGVIGLDAGRRIVLLNRAAEAMFGLTADEAYRLSLDEVVTFMADEAAGEVLPADALLSLPSREGGSKAIERQGLVAVRQDKRVVVNVAGALIESNSPEELSAILIVHNVSRERELEEMKLDFTTLAAHELRTPLTSIRGYLQMLEAEIIKAKQTVMQPMVLRAVQSTNKLAYLIDRLLQVTKIEQGRMVLNKQMVVWNQLVENTVRTYAAHGRERQITVEVVPFTRVIKVEVDMAQMEQVLSILLENALEYSADGSRVEVRVSMDNGMVRTMVKDVGKGISAEGQKRLFQPYYRVVGKFEQSEQGSGLGLYVVKSVVEAHGGEVGVESKPKQGSTFWFTLPLAGAGE